MSNANFDLDEMMGKEVKDIVTGFSGVITGKSTWLFGCNQYCVSPKISEDGGIKAGEWFDEGRIQIIGEGIRPQQVVAASGKRGGSSNHPRIK